MSNKIMMKLLMQHNKQSKLLWWMPIGKLKVKQASWAILEEEEFLSPLMVDLAKAATRSSMSSSPRGTLSHSSKKEFQLWDILPTQANQFSRLWCLGDKSKKKRRKNARKNSKEKLKSNSSLLRNGLLLERVNKKNTLRELSRKRRRSISSNFMMGNSMRIPVIFTSFRRWLRSRKCRRYAYKITLKMFRLS